MAFYLLASCLYFFMAIPHALLLEKPLLFFQDPTISERVHAAIVRNPNGDNATVTRFFDNKASFALNNIFVSVARSSDPVFFFSLAPSDAYGDNYAPFVSPIFLPFFLVGAFVCIRKWKKIHNKYQWLLPLLLISLTIDGLCMPYTLPIKLLPLFMTVQCATIIGWYELLKK